MKRPRRKVIKICQDCGCEYETQSHSKRCPECRIELKRENARRYYREKKASQGETVTPYNKPRRVEKSRKSVNDETLCWTCQNSVPDKEHGCLWSMKLEPVPGWTIHKYINSSNLGYERINVKKCPLYERDIVPVEEQKPQK